MSRFVIAIIVVLVLGAGIAQAAGPYDGKWSGTAVANTAGGSNRGACSATLTADVKDNRLRGTELFAGRSTIPFDGTIAADGSFKSSGGGIFGKFSAKSFEGAFTEKPNADCRNWHATMERAER